MDLRWKLYLSIFIIILLGFNAQAAKVSILPQTQDVTSGNNITISVLLDPEGSSIYGVQFSLIFDKTIVEAIRIDKGALLGSDGASTIEGAKSIDNANGKITYSLSRSGTGTGMTTSGTLANVTFRGLNAGATAVTFANVVISDPNASEIPGTTTGGSVTVLQQTQTATPTPTSTAAQTPAVTGTQPSSGGSTQDNTYPPGKDSKPNATATAAENTFETMHPDNTVVTLSSVCSVSENELFAVNVHITPRESVYGAELKLSFDTDILEGVSLEQGQFLGGATIVNSVDNEKGEMAYAETRTGNVAGVKAKGILAKATFRAKKAGVTAIQPEGIKLVNDDERIISDVLSDGINLTVLRMEEPPKGDAIGVYGALAALLSAALIIRIRK
ncbi:MAG: cohesin domain-containing protein [Candidatus Methanoperedens sp.]